MLDTNTGKIEPDPLTPKRWLESRTVIFNGLVALLTVAYAIAQVLQQNPQGLDPRIISVAGIIVAVGNIYLRAGTTAPIAGTPAQRKVDQALMKTALEPPVQLPH